jgi:hypothetical protein
MYFSFFYYFFLPFPRTNLPKEIMELSGYHHKCNPDKSYITANDVLEYLNDFADNFNLRKYIKVCNLYRYLKSK